ncbi:MAG TPA: GGDEF domain-containing protein [Candidatus Angelobacter sp.]|jgi:diguanylate cyclase (GGDEF)-like protein|nr:GGDEF domain-containing protein [Candidatus Angelobacter sp.]
MRQESGIGARVGSMQAHREAVAAWFGLGADQLDALSDELIMAMAERLAGEGALQGQIAELRTSAQRWAVLARTDALTGLANRRAAEERLEQETKRAVRYERPLTVLIADVDGLKAINDEHGHPAGDAVLGELATRLGRVVRASDMLARWGGDEFLMICPETDAEAAAQVAERLVREADGIVEAGDARIACGLSVGWATATEKPDARRLVRAADKALYYSKQSGRGRATGAGG